MVVLIAFEFDFIKKMFYFRMIFCWLVCLLCTYFLLANSRMGHMVGAGITSRGMGPLAVQGTES